MLKRVTCCFCCFAFVLALLVLFQRQSASQGSLGFTLGQNIVSSRMDHWQFSPSCRSLWNLSKTFLTNRTTWWVSMGIFYFLPKITQQLFENVDYLLNRSKKTNKKAAESRFTFCNTYFVLFTRVGLGCLVGHFLNSSCSFLICSIIVALLTCHNVKTQVDLITGSAPQ